MQTRKANEDDIKKIAWLEAEIFSDAWSIKSIEESFEREEALIAVCYEESDLVGYFIAYFAADEAEIMRIAVKEKYRRKGVGRRLLLALEDYCGENGINKVFLEVRESNKTGILFYLEDGFENNGLRKDFYQNPKEDAVLMYRDLKG